MKGSGEWLNDFWLTQNVQILLSKHLWFLWIPQGKIIKGKNAFYTKIIKDAYLPICNIMRTPRFPEQGLDLRPFPHLPQILKVATIKHLKMKQWTYLSAPDVGQMQVFTSDFQNFLPGLSPFARQWVFTTAEPLAAQGKGWRGNHHSLLLSVPGG